jgi:site-specific recombinase
VEYSEWNYILTKEGNSNFILNFMKFGMSNYNLNTEAFFNDLSIQLEKDEEFKLKIQQEIGALLLNLKIRKYFCDENIIEENNLISVFTSRISKIILPQIDDDQSLNSILNTLFYDKKYLNWIQKVDQDLWRKVIVHFDLNQESSIKLWIEQLEDVATILMDRIKGGYCDSELLRYMPTPLYNQGIFNTLESYVKQISEKKDFSIPFTNIEELVHECDQYLSDILMQKDQKGISLKITLKVNRLKEQLKRLKDVLNLLYLNQTSDASELVSFIITYIIQLYAPKNYIREQLSNNLNLVTFMATYHNGQTGENYITKTKLGYYKMIESSSMGGFIVAILCFFKLYISSCQLSPFIEAMGYSLNYAIGFSAIYLLKFTLATKQPAMTAANIARTFAQGNDEIQTKQFTILFSRLSRSQFVAFIGNVLMSFLIATSIFIILKHVFHLEVVSQEKATKWFEETSFPYFEIFWYAAIAGVFLFISGLSSGLFINRLRYSNVINRLYHHPVLKMSLSISRRKKIVQWFEKNAGGLFGNIVLGFLLGFAFLIGKFLGIPFDIRHITFQAGNFAIAIGGLGYNITNIELIKGFVFIFGIGFFNFIVSFTLSLILALKANRIPLKLMFPILKAVLQNFVKQPFYYFYPPSRKKEL